MRSFTIWNLPYAMVRPAQQIHATKAMRLAGRNDGLGYQRSLGFRDDNYAWAGIPDSLRGRIESGLRGKRIKTRVDQYE